MRRIICVGNRYAPEDAAGSKVYDILTRRPVPQDVEVVDGGLDGLNLLPLLEGAERVVFVDAVSGFGRPGEVIVLDTDDVRDLAAAADPEYGHAAGLAYLLRVLPDVCEAPAPDVLLVGIEGPADAETAAMAADTCLEVCCEN